MMSGTAHAMVFGARNDQLEILLRGKAAGNQGEEARPPGAAVEFHLRAKKGQRAAGADKHPGSLLIVERARERALGAFLAQHVVLCWRQKLFPFGVGLG